MKIKFKVSKTVVMTQIVELAVPDDVVNGDDTIPMYEDSVYDYFYEHVNEVVYDEAALHEWDYEELVYNWDVAEEEDLE